MAMTSSSASSGFGQQQSGSQSSYGTAFSPIAQQRMNQLYPYIRSQLPTSTAFSNYFPSVGGPTMKMPGITVGGVFTPQQTQQQIDQALGSADQMMGKGLMQARNQFMGGTGAAQTGNFNNASQALQNQNLSAHLSIPATIGLQQAQANATQRLASEQAAAQVAESQVQQDIQRRQLALQAQQQAMQNQAALLQSLYSYNQPLPFGQSSSSSTGRQGSSSVSFSGDLTPLSLASGGLSA